MVGCKPEEVLSNMQGPEHSVQCSLEIGKLAAVHTISLMETDRCLKTTLMFGLIFKCYTGICNSRTYPGMMKEVAVTCSDRFVLLGSLLVYILAVVSISVADLLPEYQTNV